MKIINVMSSKLLGGLEQAFLDYNEALGVEGHQVFAIYNKLGKIKDRIKPLGNVEYLPSIFFKPNFLLIPYYFFKIKIIKPQMIIVQSRKVISIFSFIGRILKIPVVLVCHVEKTKLMNKADFIFSITEYQKNVLVKAGFPKEKVFVIPNMITFKRAYKEFKDFSNPVSFGIIGRFDPMKGFKTFIEACNILRNRGENFIAKIAGSPQKQYIAEYKEIKHLIAYYNLEKYIEFIGWVDNKDEFYSNIDIFVLPSNYEPFGIVLLEAMMFSKPIISSLAEGPSEIFKNTKAALTFNVGDANGLADKMVEILKNKKLAGEIAKNGYNLVNEKYTLFQVAKLINECVEEIYETSKS